MTGAWTLDELVERVARALAARDVRAPNGRVTGVPDARMIRWYATIGLVDKPSALRGRTALYGHRHLLQLVAVKRRQAEGRPLAEIQAELAGASDAALARLTGLEPADPAPPIASPPAAAPPAAAPPAAAPAAPEPALSGPAPAGERFWLRRPAPASPVQPLVHPELRHGVTLGDAVLVLPTTVTEADVAAIRAAAAPLIELLRQRGITTQEGAQ